ncbi:MAG: bifunctional nuclease family protein [Aquificae bacterium]|nr:bifunctional nuclease family protein [Aquificota bacterium]
MIEMSVQGITLDPVTNMPIVVLKGKDTNDVLPIWIGVFEANAIAMQLEGIKRPRPMTHDLITNLISELSGRVEYIHIHDLKDNTYYAEISIVKDGEVLKIDSRPSDAINIALRTGAPIFVSPKVLEDFNVEEKLDMEEEELKEWLESIKPEDFGKAV